MHLIEIPDIKFKKEIPSEISEMTEAQFVHFADLYIRFSEKQISFHDLKVSMVMKLLDVNNGFRNYEKLKESVQVRISENINRITELLDYLFVIEDDKLSLNLAFTRNFVGQLGVQKVLMLYGPSDALTDISFLEYKDANTHYRAYLKTKNEADLNHLIAVLYRPKTFMGKKVKYKPELIERRVKLISKIPLSIRYAIFLFYLASENFLQHGTVTIDGEEINMKLLYETTLEEKKHDEKPKYEAKTGLAGVALSLAGTGIFGTIEKVYEQNLYDVRVLLYKQRVEYLNRLEKIK